MSDVHNGVIVGCQRSFFFLFPSGYNIDDSFVLVDCYQLFFYGSSAIVACSLNHINILLLYKYCCRLNISFVC